MLQRGGSSRACPTARTEAGGRRAWSRRPRAAAARRPSSFGWRSSPSVAVASLLAGLWQLAVAGHAAWAAAGAAEAAARAVAVGGDARGAARRRLAAPLERGLRVRADDDGGVRVTVRVPSTFGLHVGTVSARARFAPQR